MTELPTGTVTLLFSDIEGSTALLNRLGDRYADVLSAQRRILRTAFAAHHGHELGTEGDSFFVAFPTAADAVEAARTGQHDLATHHWPDGVHVRVRMGLHTGEPMLHEDGYVGMDVHRAARMAASAHGGQIVVSATTQRLVSTPPPGVSFIDLGRHRLKDIPDTEHLYQVAADGLDADFPALKSLGAASTLPVPPSPIVGRDGELRDLTELLRRADVRLVTLTGPGGSGKTRLAVATAARLEPHMPDGVYFVSLGDATTAELMWSGIAETLGATGAQRVQETVLLHLATRRCLLVLDNLEQLDRAPDVVATLLSAGAGVRLLATSRRLLRVGGEYEHAVPPLELPKAPDARLVDAQESGAVVLFVQRATMARSGFTLTDDNVADVVQICRRLDGLPLALELAAARLKLMSPAALVRRLDTILGVNVRMAGRPARQQTLRSTIEWSYSLLGADLQRDFRRLGVFAGPFDLAAAGAVLAGDAPADPFDAISDLVDSSLVMLADGDDSEPRFRLLRTISAFAADVLAAEGDDRADARARHAEHYLAVLEALPTQRDGAAHLLVRGRIEAELGNLRAALSWALDDSEAPDDPARVDIGLRLCQALSWFWYVCGYQSEGRTWLARAVDAAGDEHSDRLMGSMHMLGVLLQQQGEWDSSRTALEHCLEYWRERDDQSLVARELNSLGCGYRAVGDAGTARRLLMESIETARACGDESRGATAMSNLAILEVDEGRAAVAIDLLHEVLEIDVRSGDEWGVVHDWCNLAAAMMQDGRVDEAWTLLRRHARSVIDLGDIELVITVIELFCLCLSELGDEVAAAHLLGAAQQWRIRAELPIAVPDEAILDVAVDKVRDTPSPADWAANVEAGRAYSTEDAMTEAMRER